MWRPKVDAGNHPLLLIHFIHSGRFSQLNPELLNMANLTSQLTFGNPQSPAFLAGITYPEFTWVSEDLNFGPDVCMVSILTIGPSPRPILGFLFF